MIDPIEFDSAFGNLLSGMIDAMEKDFNIETVNLELQELADEAILDQVQMQYDEMVIELSELELMYQAMMASYDEDAIAYGEM